MIEYFKEIFSKPTYRWKTIETLSVMGVIVAICLVIYLTYFFINLLVKHRLNQRYKTCAVKNCTHYDNDCSRCRIYQKRPKEKKEKKHGI